VSTHFAAPDSGQPARTADHTAYLGSIRDDADLMSAVVRTGSLDTPVAACPGWDVRKVVEHTGFIHRWATHAIRTRSAPGRGDVTPAGEDDDLAVWIVDGAASLIDALGAVDPDADTWHPFPFEQKTWVWGRRQAIETTLHRWDVQSACGVEATIDAGLASRGIHEFFELGMPRILQKAETGPPSASLHVHCTDVDGEWLVWSDDEQYRMLPVHDKGNAAMRGPAQDLLLVLMGRLDRAEIDIVGDAEAADSWLDVGTW